MKKRTEWTAQNIDSESSRHLGAQARETGRGKGVLPRRHVFTRLYFFYRNVLSNPVGKGINVNNVTAISHKYITKIENCRHASINVR